MACGGKVKKHQGGGTAQYTKAQLNGEEPVKTVNGVNYYFNGDGKVVADPKGRQSINTWD